MLFKASFNCQLDLHHLASTLVNVKYNPKNFCGLSWRHRHIQLGILVFKSGSLIVHGATSKVQAVKCIRQYARLLSVKFGYHIKLSKVKLVTASLLSNIGNRLDLHNLAKNYPGCKYEVELFNAAFLNKNKVHFSMFSSGRIVITGVTNLSLINSVIQPTLIELSLF